MTDAWGGAPEPAPVKSSFHRPSVPLHPSHFAILRDRWRRLGQALIAIVLMVLWFGVSGSDTALTAAGGIAAFIALTLTAIRDERLGFRIDAAVKVVMFLLVAAIMVLLWISLDREEDPDSSVEFYREPAFFGVLFVVTMMLLFVVRTVDLVRWHLQLAVRPPTLSLDQQGFVVHTLGTRAFVRWHHLERVSVAGHTLVVSFRPGRPDSERPPSFRWSPKLSGYRVADLRQFTGDRPEVIRSLAHFAGPAYQPNG